MEIPDELSILTAAQHAAPIFGNYGHQDVVMSPEISEEAAPCLPFFL